MRGGGVGFTTSQGSCVSCASNFENVKLQSYVVFIKPAHLPFFAGLWGTLPWDKRQTWCDYKHKGASRLAWTHVLILGMPSTWLHVNDSIRFILNTYEVL